MTNRVSTLGIDLRDAAWEMMKSREYQNAKCDYGRFQADTEDFSVAIPNLSIGYSNPAVGIINGNMTFKRYMALPFNAYTKI